MQDLRPRWDAPRLVALGAGAGAIVITVTATGDVLLLGVLLGLAALDAVVGAGAVLVGLAALGRWGSTSLAAVAGAQAVLGPAGWTGSATAVLSSWSGALALLLLAPPRLVPVLAFGLAAAELVAGPAVGTGSLGGPLALRVAASAAAVAVAWACAHRVPRGLALRAGLVLAAAAVALGFVA
jgi:hypothetical protein